MTVRVWRSVPNDRSRRLRLGLAALLLAIPTGCGDKAPEHKVTKTIVPKQEGRKFGGIAGDGAWEGHDAGAPEEIPPVRDEPMKGEGVSELLD